MAPVEPAVVAKPPQLVSGDYSDKGSFVYVTPSPSWRLSACRAALERMQGRRGATAGPPVICRTHVQGLGRACHMDLAGQAKVDNESDKPAV